MCVKAHLFRRAGERKHTRIVSGGGRTREEVGIAWKMKRQKRTRPDRLSEPFRQPLWHPLPRQPQRRLNSVVDHRRHHRRRLNAIGNPSTSHHQRRQWTSRRWTRTSRWTARRPSTCRHRSSCSQSSVAFLHGRQDRAQSAASPARRVCWSSTPSGTASAACANPDPRPSSRRYSG